MKQQTTYNGNHLFKINNGLYDYEDIDFEESKKAILKAFKKEYENKLKTALEIIGLKFIKLTYFSPKYYNYETDSIDLTISIKDIKTYKEYIIKSKEDINTALKKNKSYDGYLALTKTDINAEIDAIENNKYYSPDIIVLSVILSKLISFKEWDKHDYLIYEPETLRED